jgi:hypothetical protein
VQLQPARLQASDDYAVWLNPGCAVGGFHTVLGVGDRPIKTPGLNHGVFYRWYRNSAPSVNVYTKQFIIDLIVIET